MINRVDFNAQYQVRPGNCSNRYQLANRLINTFGYHRAVKVCRENHWSGVMQTLAAIKDL